MLSTQQSRSAASKNFFDCARASHAITDDEQILSCHIS